jgi:hypothetical protein
VLQPYKSFGMVCAKQQRTNHAKPSLRSGTDLKVKPMLGGRLRRKVRSIKMNKINYRPMVFSTFQKDNIYKSEKVIDEVWLRIERLSSSAILNDDFTTNTSEEVRQELIKYISTRICQAVEFRNASREQTLLTKPLLLYYSMLNLVRAYIAMDQEKMSTTSHGLHFNLNNEILKCSASIRKGTFLDYLELKGIELPIGTEISLKSALENIIEFKRELLECNTMQLGYIPLALSAYKDGELIATVLEYDGNLSENWREEFQSIKNDARFENGKIFIKKEEFVDEKRLEDYVNKYFLSDLSYLSPNESCIWYSYKNRDIKSLPRLCYYFIAFYILSNIVRYEPESMQEIINKKDSIFWIINKLQYFGDRYFPQLILCDIYNRPIYFST